MNKLKLIINSLCVYNTEDDEAFEYLKDVFDEDYSEELVENCSGFFRSLAPDYSLKNYVSRFILQNDNPFSRAAAAGNEIPEPLLEGARADLRKLEELSRLTLDNIIQCSEEETAVVLKTMPRWKTGEAELPLKIGWDLQLDELISYYRENGYGIFSSYSAFKWRDEELEPITALNEIKLSDLKNYELQRNQVVENTLAFLDGFPANNVLLYGDRGTGKSSTVHAVLNEYKSRGLRMIEISKSDIEELSLIREKIYGCPLKFIIFIDDLSFDSREDSFGELKAALEGSLSGRQKNVLIYATSNRRHLIRESFSDRENDVHLNDTIQEELSLSERFGLSVCFLNPDKKEYLEITEKIAKDRGIKTETDELLNAAENWARRRGGRSPRVAKQFVDYIQACEERNKTPKF